MPEGTDIAVYLCAYVGTLKNTIKRDTFQNWVFCESLKNKSLLCQSMQEKQLFGVRGEKVPAEQDGLPRTASFENWSLTQIQADYYDKSAYLQLSKSMACVILDVLHHLAELWTRLLIDLKQVQDGRLDLMELTLTDQTLISSMSWVGSNRSYPIADFVSNRLCRPETPEESLCRRVSQLCDPLQGITGSFSFGKRGSPRIHFPASALKGSGLETPFYVYADVDPSCDSGRMYLADSPGVGLELMIEEMDGRETGQVHSLRTRMVFDRVRKTLITLFKLVKANPSRFPINFGDLESAFEAILSWTAPTREWLETEANEDELWRSSRPILWNEILGFSGYTRNARNPDGSPGLFNWSVKLAIAEVLNQRVGKGCLKPRRMREGDEWWAVCYGLVDHLEGYRSREWLILAAGGIPIFGKDGKASATGIVNWESKWGLQRIGSKLHLAMVVVGLQKMRRSLGQERLGRLLKKLVEARARLRNGGSSGKNKTGRR